MKKVQTENDDQSFKLKQSEIRRERGRWRSIQPSMKKFQTEIDDQSFKLQQSKVGEARRYKGGR